ncbi:hypothetical protein [Streptomyces lavendulae]
MRPRPARPPRPPAPRPAHATDPAELLLLLDMLGLHPDDDPPGPAR